MSNIPKPKPKGKSSWPPSILTGPTANIALQGHEESQGSIFCIAINEKIGEFVTGSADHALRAWDLKTGKSKRELFKNKGHQEWVTACDYLGDDSIVSGSMDCQVIHWGKGSVRGTFVGNHNSVTQLCGIDRYIVSAGYDGCVILWDAIACKNLSSVEIDKRGLTVMLRLDKTTEGPIRFAVGGRSGICGLVSLDLAECRLTLLWSAPLHQEAVVSLGACPKASKDEFVSGGGDGRCAVWREGKNVWLSAQNKGTITFAAYECGSKGQTPRVTYGTSLGEIHIYPLTKKENANIIRASNLPVCEGVLLNRILITGDAGGSIVCHELTDDLTSGEATSRWAFGALRMAVRVIAVSESRETVIIGGEEAVGMMLKFT